MGLTKTLLGYPIVWVDGLARGISLGPFSVKEASMPKDIVVTPDVMDWLDKYIERWRGWTCGERKVRPVCGAGGVICREAHGKGECPVKRAAGKTCLSLDILKNASSDLYGRGKAGYAARGAWLDYIVAVRERCTVDDGTVARSSLKPGTFYRTARFGPGTTVFMKLNMNDPRFAALGQEYALAVNDGYLYRVNDLDKRVRVVKMVEDGGGK